jgi:hypothetical protein
VTKQSTTNIVTAHNSASYLGQKHTLHLLIFNSNFHLEISLVLIDIYRVFPFCILFQSINESLLGTWPTSPGVTEVTKRDKFSNQENSFKQGNQAFWFLIYICSGLVFLKLKWLAAQNVYRLLSIKQAAHNAMLSHKFFILSHQADTASAGFLTMWYAKILSKFYMKEGTRDHGLWSPHCIKFSEYAEWGPWSQALCHIQKIWSCTAVNLKTFIQQTLQSKVTCPRSQAWSMTGVELDKVRHLNH